jgi:hypothetical protein
MKGLFDFKEILPVYMWDQALYKSKIKSTGRPFLQGQGRKNQKFSKNNTGRFLN